jgi:hypothetical protein
MHPFTMIVAGPTMSGKSTWIKNLLLLNKQLISPAPERILWIYKRWQPLYDELKYWIPSMKFIQGITEDIKTDKFINSRERTLLIIDDMMKDATQDKEICELFTEGAHHRNLSVICIMQNLFNKGKENRTMSLNSQYIVLFKNPRDRQQIATLARQMYPGNSNKLLDAYERAVSVPYGSLILDLKQVTPESMRFQTDIFKSYIGMVDNSNRHLTADRQRDRLSVNPAPNRPNQHLTVEMAYQQNPGTQEFYYPPSTSWAPPLNSGNTPTMEIEEKYPSCVDCGTMFASSYDLQRHTKNGCSMDLEDDDAKSDVSKEDDDSGFTLLINQVLEENQPLFDRKLDQLMEENSKLSRQEAREDVRDMMLPKDRALLFRKYKRILHITANLNKSKLHRNIRKEISTLMENNDIDLSKAISRVLNKHKLDFDELLEMEDITEDEESDDEYDDDSDDDDEESDTESGEEENE